MLAEPRRRHDRRRCRLSRDDRAGRDRWWSRIAERFGPDVVAEDGSIDRRLLAGIVFADRAALADLDKITHPAVIDEVQEQIAASGLRSSPSMPSN